MAMPMLTRELIARLPKAELHVHLDGSLRPETMLDLARASGVELPSRDPETIRRYMLVDDARDLEEYLRRFDITIAMLQTPEAIERVAYEMVEDAARDRLRLLEVRYCPALSTRTGLTLSEVLDAELRGLRRGERDFGVRTAVINCSLRHYDPAVSVQIAEASVAFRERGVVGFDLAGPEAGRPPQIHRAAFELAARGGLGITVHAGEAAGAASVAEAVHSCHANRIGHGTRLFEDPGLQAYVRDRRILIETNITSNLQTHAVMRAADHPVRAYFDAGLAVTLCTDSWLMSGVSLTDEYWLAHTALGFTREEIDRMILNAFAASFLPWPDRQALLDEVAAELEATQ
jgi:adenosine deaminase